MLFRSLPWTRSPEMNYSRIVVEAIMAMKRHPVKIPPSGRVPEQGCRSLSICFMKNISVPDKIRVEGNL